jgi:hypothetical protein
VKKQKEKVKKKINVPKYSAKKARTETLKINATPDEIVNVLFKK